MGLSLKPLSDRVVIEAAAAEEKSSGGIILPDTAKRNHSKELSLLSDQVKLVILGH